MLKTALIGCIGCVVVAMIATAGCVSVDARAPQSVDVGSGQGQPPPLPAYDGRSMDELRRDNAALRQKLDKLESDNLTLSSTIDRRQAEIKDLKKQRDQLKKERDKAKKALD